MSFEVSAKTLKVMIRNDIRLIKSGRMEFDAFIQRAHQWRDACWSRGIFCDWPAFREFILKEKLNEEDVKDIQSIWEDGVV